MPGPNQHQTFVKIKFFFWLGAFGREHPTKVEFYVDITSLRKEELRSTSFLKLLMSTLNFDLLLGGGLRRRHPKVTSKFKLTLGFGVGARLRLPHPNQMLTINSLCLGVWEAAKRSFPPKHKRNLKFTLFGGKATQTGPWPQDDLTFVLFSFLVGWGEAHHPTNKKLKITMVKS